MILLIRNAIFCIAIFAITLTYALLAIFIMHSYKTSRKVAMLWCFLIFKCSKYIVGINYKVHNEKLIRSRGVIIACNHCSAWETFFLAYYFNVPVFILKRSLFHIPLIGLFCKALGMIGIDRNSYSKKHRAHIVSRTNYELSRKRNIVIFPQGTRVPSGETYNYEKFPYKPGITIFAGGHKVVTASTNARKCFGKSLFSFKKSGQIDIIFNESISFEKDASKDEILSKVRTSIENGCKKLDGISV